MTESSPTPGRPFDPSKPFENLVLCCTSIEADLRTEIAQRTVDLGGVHKYDLTPDVTHLIVGDYDTAKYRHVARERPDIKPMAAGWVDAVRELWLEDAEFDFAALESTWRLKTFEAGGGIPKSPVVEQRERIRLICCLTGFEDNETRSSIESKVKANGGEYVGDLSRAVTHLIVNRPEGKKYIAARKWRIRTVSIEWLHDSIERGMILNEECYDPTLPAEERGKNAWIRRDLNWGALLGKRRRDGATGATGALVDEGRRKLRKTASMKLTSQKDNLWSDILVNQSSTDLSRSMIVTGTGETPAYVPPDPHSTGLTTPGVETSHLAQPSHVQRAEAGVFSSCRFYVHGFPQNKQEILGHHILSHDGQVSRSIEDAASSIHDEPPDRRYLIVPQTSRPESHPEPPKGMRIVTEFYIERCVHNKTLFEPNDHVLGQPFPRFPIDGFRNLTICTAGFRNEQLNQVEKAITQLGAKYSERLNPQCSLLVCPSLDQIRKQKLDFAVISRIPIVNAGWLWQCITTGCLVPWANFLFKELAQSVSTSAERWAEDKRKDRITSSKWEPVHKKVPRATSASAPATAMKHGIDMTAFDDNMSMPQDTAAEERDPSDTDQTNYETAPTHQTEDANTRHATTSEPLSEMTSNALNKSPSPQKACPQKKSPPQKLKRAPTGGEIGDSEGDDDSDTPINPLEEDDSSANKGEEERERKAVRTKATEREEMSKRLNSLVSRDGVASEGDNLKPQPAPPGQRRKRKILGRAASNVSATSSASAESLTHASSFKSNSRRTESIASHLDSAQTSTGAFGLLNNMIIQQNDDGNLATRIGDSPPRATQLEYDKSEARQQRATVLGRISKQDGSCDSKPDQEKVSLASLKNDVGSSGNTHRSSTRRSAKRR